MVAATLRVSAHPHPDVMVPTVEHQHDRRGRALAQRLLLTKIVVVGGLLAELTRIDVQRGGTGMLQRPGTGIQRQGNAHDGLVGVVRGQAAHDDAIGTQYTGQAFQVGRCLGMGHFERSPRIERAVERQGPQAPRVGNCRYQCIAQRQHIGSRGPALITQRHDRPDGLCGRAGIGRDELLRRAQGILAGTAPDQGGEDEQGGKEDARPTASVWPIVPERQWAIDLLPRLPIAYCPTTQFHTPIVAPMTTPGVTGRCFGSKLV